MCSLWCTRFSHVTGGIHSATCLFLWGQFLYCLPIYTLFIYIKVCSFTMLSTPHYISSVLILNLSFYIISCFKRDLFASILTTNVYAHHIPSMQASCPNRLFLLDFKILITHCEVYSSLICDFLVPSLTASLLGPYNFLSTLSQAPRVCIVPLICKTHPPPLFN